MQTGFVKPEASPVILGVSSVKKSSKLNNFQIKNVYRSVKGRKENKIHYNNHTVLSSKKFCK